MQFSTVTNHPMTPHPREVKQARRQAAQKAKHAQIHKEQFKMQKIKQAHDDAQEDKEKLNKKQQCTK